MEKTPDDERQILLLLTLQPSVKIKVTESDTKWLWLTVCIGMVGMKIFG